jgi:hypothetical protein
VEWHSVSRHVRLRGEYRLIAHGALGCGVRCVPGHSCFYLTNLLSLSEKYWKNRGHFVFLTKIKTKLFLQKAESSHHKIELHFLVYITLQK